MDVNRQHRSAKLYRQVVCGLKNETMALSPKTPLCGVLKALDGVVVYTYQRSQNKDSHQAAKTHTPVL